MMLPVKTITEHAHNLYRMSSSLRSIAYDLHYCPGSKNYRRQNKMTFSPELYIIALKKVNGFTFFIYLIFTYIRNFLKTENNDFGISYYFNREAKNTNFIVFGLTRPEHEPMSTRTLTFTLLSNCRYCCFVILSLMQSICDT